MAAFDSVGSSEGARVAQVEALERSVRECAVLLAAAAAGYREANAELGKARSLGEGELRQVEKATELLMRPRAQPEVPDGGELLELLGEGRQTIATPPAPSSAAQLASERKLRACQVMKQVPSTVLSDKI